jgi:hypothetical protein
MDEQAELIRRNILLQREIIRMRWGADTLERADSLVEMQVSVSVDNLLRQPE